MKVNVNRVTSFAVIGFMLVMVLFVGITSAVAEEKVVNAPITSVSTQLDRNGNEYTRLIVEEVRKLSGVEYKAGTAAMAFGDLNVKAKQLKAGDTLKAIVSSREYNGRTSYTLMAFIE